MYRIAIVVFLLTTVVTWAKIYSFKEIEVMPKSITKDYYTWRLLQTKKLSKDEALIAYRWTSRKNAKLKKAIRKIVGYVPKDKKTKAKKEPKNFIIYPATAAKKSKSYLKKLYKKIQKQGKYSDVLNVTSSENPFSMLSTLKPQAQCYIFNNIGSRYRKKYFNHYFSKEQLFKFSKEEQFNTLIHKAVTTHALQNIKESLLFTPTDKLSFNATFLLAMNAIEFNALNKAIYYLEIAKTKKIFQSKQDHCNFWLYLITKEQKYLNELIESNQINLYTLRARDILKKPTLRSLLLIYL